MADITRLTGLEFTNEPGILELGFYVPNMTTVEIQAIPPELLKFGGIVFDTTSEELLTYTAAGFWLPVLTAESDLVVENLEVTGTATILTANINGVATIATANMTTANVNTLSGAAGNFISMNISNGIVSNLTCGVITSNMIAGLGPTNGISPLTVSLDVGAGTGATSVIKGSVMSGTFQLNTGSSPQSGGIIGTFTIPSSLVAQFDGDYGVCFMPASLTTSSIPVYVTTSSPSNLFLFGVGPVALTASTSYFWNYHIIGTNRSN